MRWVYRGLLQAPLHLGVALDEKGFHRGLRHLQVPTEQWPPFVSPGADATTYFFEQAEERREAAIVCLRLGDASDVRVSGLIVHEVMHLWQRCLRLWGEDAPGAELEAYSVQQLYLQVADAVFAARRAPARPSRRRRVNS